jgi:hypothetical protein
MEIMAQLPKAVREYVEASNAFDENRLIAAFAKDAFVNDARREFWGAEAIKRWSDKEIIGDNVTMDPTKVIEHYDVVSVDAIMDGNYDKTKLPPGPLILTHYFTIRGDKIVRLIIIRNIPPQ